MLSRSQSNTNKPTLQAFELCSGSASKQIASIFSKETRIALNCQLLSTSQNSRDSKEQESKKPHMDNKF